MINADSQMIVTTIFYSFYNAKSTTSLISGSLQSPLGS